MVAYFHVLGKNRIRLQGQQETLSLVQHINLLPLFLGVGEGRQTHHQGEDQRSAHGDNRQEGLPPEGLFNVPCYL